MKIEIAISCVWFQRRLCWMLSSLAQQISPPQLTVSVAYMPNNGDPSTESVCSFFNDNYLNVKQFVLSPDEIQYRGIARNRQLEDTDADWMLFADSDLVYDKKFFADLSRQLAGPLASETRCISASRISLDKDYCNKILSHWDCRNMFVDEVANVVSQFPRNRGMGRGVGKDGVTRNVGAGYFQLANVNSLRKNFGGTYWDPSGRRDPSWGYKSDRQFRKRVGGICPIVTLPQYHLNHDRDCETHLEIQR